MKVSEAQAIIDYYWGLGYLTQDEKSTVETKIRRTSNRDAVVSGYFGDLIDVEWVELEQITI